MLVAILRPGIAWLWKLLALALFCFYCLWYYPDLMESWSWYKGASAGSIIGSWLLYLPSFLALILFLFWPVSLFLSMTGSAMALERILKKLVVVSALFWMAWLLLYFYRPDMDLLSRKIETWVQIPAPPTAPQ